MKKVFVVVGAALAGCAVAAVVVGALSRLCMRLISLAAGAAGDFSWGGSFFIVLAYAMFMVPGALLAASTTRRWRSVLLVAGALLLCVPAVGVASEELGDTGHFSTVQWAGVLAASVAVFGTIAAMPVATLRVVDRLLGRRPALRSVA